MNIVEWLQRLMTQFGAGWVMWLLIVLSVISLAVMLERAWFYYTLRDDLPKLVADFRALLRKGDLAGARKRLEASPSAEAAVVLVGINEADHGAKSADEAMMGAVALQRMKLERRLAFLGTLGNNAPFIGLFGTVIGVVEAFEGLAAQDAVAAQAQSSAMAPQQVMGAIAEALVATAVGLVVAIPAVVMFNYFMRHSKAVLANTEALTRVLLAHLVADNSGASDSDGEE